MARLPTGWKWADSRRKSTGAVDPSGVLHTRQDAENRGAREVGYRNSYEQRKARAGVKLLQADPAADGGRYSSARKNYRADLARARETAAIRGERFDRAKFDASIGAVGGTDRSRSRRALNMFLYLTGRTDRPNAGY